MAIDATAGGSSANSYVTAAEATTYFGDRTPSTAWDDASEAEQEDALLTAARRMEQGDYRGQRKNPPTGTSAEPTQALAFPRYGVVSKDGWTYLDTVIPEGIKRAQMELAYAILAGDVSLADSGLEAFKRAKIGPIEVEPRHTQRAGELPENVKRELRPFLVGGAVNVPLLRS